MNMLDYMLNEMVDELSSDSVYMEKATTEEYRISKFKQKYQYDPKKKTIIIDGEKYRCDLDNLSSKKAKIEPLNPNSKTVDRTICITTSGDESTVILTKDFFNLKNPKRSEAVLQHEVGHSKLHTMNPKNPHLNKEAFSKEVYDDAINELFNECYNDFCERYKEYCIKNKIGPKYYHKIVDSKIVKAFIMKIIQKTCPMSRFEAKKMDKNAIKSTVRSDMRKAFKEYEKKELCKHANVDEFEADRYAANKTSAKDVKKGLAELYKKESKNDKEFRKASYEEISDEDLKKFNKESRDINKEQEKAGKKGREPQISREDLINEYKHDFNKRASIDMKMRAKALKDKRAITSDIYK